MSPATALALPRPEPSSERSEVHEPVRRAETAAAALDDRAWAEAYRKQRGITKSAMGDLLGFSRSHYSRWEEGQYDADTAKNIETKVRLLRDKEEAVRGLSKVVGFRPIKTATQVWQCLDLAWAGEMVVLVAESGAGKTEAIREARRRALAAHKPLPIYVRATTFTSGYALVWAIAHEAGLERKGNPDALLRAIADKLHEEPRIVILDEAHRAHPKAIEALRDLWDMAGVGILMSFTSQVAGLARNALGKANLLADVLEHRPEAEQITRRVLIREIEGITPEEVEDIAHDVLGACTADARERLIQRAARSTGRLVRMLDAIQRLRTAKKIAGPVDVDQVERAWQQLYKRKQLAVSKGKPA